MKTIKYFFIFLFIINQSGVFAQSQEDIQALEQTSVNIRKAFAKGDLKTIQQYHHPKVIKALAYDKILEGREAVMNDLKGTLENYQLEFQKNEVESLLIEGDLAVEQTSFEIKIIAKNDEESFIFKGRTMVVYQRYQKSPTGWVSIREIIQPESN